MKAQFTLYVDSNTELSWDIEGENLRELLNQVDKMEKIADEWGQEAIDRKPLTVRQRISGRIFPMVLFIEGLVLGFVVSPYILKFLGIHP